MFVGGGTDNIIIYKLQIHNGGWAVGVIGPHFSLSHSSSSWIQIRLHTELKPCMLSRTAIVDLNPIKAVGRGEVVDLW